MTKVYEVFHAKTKPQLRLINNKNFTYKEILYFINKYLNSNKKVLDIGTGTGTIALYIGSKNKYVLGIDISKKAIEAAKSNSKNLGLKNVFFKVMDFPEKVPSSKYDMIICSEVLEHLKNDKKALKLIYRLLKPGGIAIISTPSKNAPLYKLGLASEFDKKVGHLRRYEIDEIIEKCRKVGFKIVEVKKTEGIVRNYFFINPYAGKLVRFIKFFLTDIFSFVDFISLKLFGESQIFVILSKSKIM